MVADKTRGAESAAKKAPAQKAAAKKASAPVKKAAAKKAAAKEAAAEVTAAGEPGAEEAPAEEAAPKKGTAKKSAVKQSTAKKSAVTKTAARKAAGKKAAAGPAAADGPETAELAAVSGKQAASAAEGAAQAAQTGAETVVAKKSPGSAATAGIKAVPQARATTAVVPGQLAVRPGEDPWTPDEIAEARAELDGEVLRLRAEIVSAEEALSGLMRDSAADSAGDDDADTGTKNMTREHEMSLAANAREMLEQTERARDRLDAGTYGICENCGKPIGKARVQAFPRATLCVECKQKQERRY
ncbi:TraR/DksA family transcriptional regulator [Streptomyces cremeus]|uniref:TraR/DksA family transcriptional regulator n=1 Tax=Streptomyces cremeus TaxID=66881 RepID=A0ABV5PD16_STRCM